MKTIKIACTTKDSIALEKLTPLQGELKSLSKDDYQKLRKQIVDTGFAFPVFAWKGPKGKTYILGGHQRCRVLQEMQKAEGYKIPALPVVYVEAKDIQAAKRRVLQDVSQYGHVERQGLYEFMSGAGLGMDELAGSFTVPAMELDLGAFKAEYFGEPAVVTEESKALIKAWEYQNKSTKQRAQVLNGDCLGLLKTIPDNSIDSVVTDPPYGLSESPDISEVLSAWMGGKPYTPKAAGGFMGKEWDAFVPGPEYWREVIRVMKPGAHALVFAGTRTIDIMGIALRLAGLEYRDTLMWLYGQGFPKSHNVSKAIDASVGAERKVIGKHAKPAKSIYSQGEKDMPDDVELTTPATAPAKFYDGWGTALKPAWEPVLLFQKPLSESTVAANVLKWSTGGLNIDGTRIGFKSVEDKAAAAAAAAAAQSLRQKSNKSLVSFGCEGNKSSLDPYLAGLDRGRFPANLLLNHTPSCIELKAGKLKAGKAGFHPGVTKANEKRRKTPSVSSYQDDAGEWDCAAECPVRQLDAQSGNLKTSNGPTKRGGLGFKGGAGGENQTRRMANEGGASRFFYCAKTSSTERHAGVDAKNNHPTLKPLDLMAYLARLITPPKGTVLDCFAGSGSTGCAAVQEGFSFIGMEREPDYAKIAQARIKHHLPKA